MRNKLMHLVDFLLLLLFVKKKKTDLMCFRKLFRALNVRESFLPVEYAEVPFLSFGKIVIKKKYKKKKELIEAPEFLFPSTTKANFWRK